MPGFARRVADRIGTSWKPLAVALLATAGVAGSIAPSSAFFDPPAHGSALLRDAPSGANVVGRGIAGQHDRFEAEAPAGYIDDVDAPLGANVIGRGIAGFHGRL